MESPQACDAVRSTCKDFTETSVCRHHVTIDATAIPALANEMRHVTETTGLIQWDEEKWHYVCPLEWPAAIRNERMASYILALDAINFCFWPEPSYEYIHISTTMTRMAQADHDKQQESINAPDGDASLNLVHPAYALSASNLESMSVDQMRALFERHAVADALVAAVPPDLEQRCRLWNEVGRLIQNSFDGSVMSFIATANGSAPALVQLLVDHCPGFQDRHTQTSNVTAESTPTLIHFYKRAQICVGDWNESLQLQLSDMDKLTTFADYRVPQLLRHHNVLIYSKPLAALVDDRVELQKGSDEELAIRACTVTAVELLVDELKQSTGCTSDTTTGKWNAVAADWHLWQVGERMQNDGELQPHHRVRTTFY